MEKIRVLIADDIEIIAESHKRLLSENDNIEIVYIANNGQEEYDKIIELKPDVVITDNQMPLMTGIEVIEKVKNSNFINKPTFILVTGDYGQDLYKKCMELEVFKIVRKSGNTRELLYAIEDYLAIKNEISEKEDTIVILNEQLHKKNILKSFLEKLKCKI